MNSTESEPSPTAKVVSMERPVEGPFEVQIPNAPIKNEASTDAHKAATDQPGWAGEESSLNRMSTAGPSSKFHMQEFEETTITRREKCKRHWRRFWCCYLSLGVVLLAILLPILFLVVLPFVVQALVDKANLKIYGGAFLANTADTAVVSISTALDIPPGIQAYIDPLTLYLYDKNDSNHSPFLGLDLARTDLKGHTDVSVDNQVVTITNQTAMVTWLGGVFKNAKTPMSVKGSTTVHVGALKLHVNLDKTQEIDTLDNLNGFDFGTLALVVPPDEDGTNIQGNLTLPNWSPLTIGLGNVTLNILSGSYLIGTASLLDVVLPPGNSTLNFRGRLFYETVLANIGPIVSSQAHALKDGNLEVSASGNASVIDGQHITYVEDVLNAQHLSTQIPILELLAQLSSQFLTDGSALGDALGDLLGSLENITGDDTGGLAAALFKQVNLGKAISIASAAYLDIMSR